MKRYFSSDLFTLYRSMCEPFVFIEDPEEQIRFITGSFQVRPIARSVAGMFGR